MPESRAWSFLSNKKLDFLMKVGVFLISLLRRLGTTRSIASIRIAYDFMHFFYTLSMVLEKNHFCFRYFFSLFRICIYFCPALLVKH